VALDGERRRDGQIVISDVLWEIDDGPTLEHELKGFGGKLIHIPRRKVLWPRGELLGAVKMPPPGEERFAVFEAASSSH